MNRNKEIRSAGLKVTHARKSILKILETSKKSHLSADDIDKLLIKKKDDIGIATIYRVLNQFVDAGICIKHHFDSEQAVFELNPIEHHDHMICIKTGKVIEFEDDVIEKRQEALAKTKGYKIIDHSLILSPHSLKPLH